MPVKTAILHDALPFYGGAERTLAAMLDVLPEAEVFTLVHNPDRLAGTPLAGARIHSTWLDRLPGVHRDHYRYFPLFPLALRSLDLSGFDLVISSHYAVAHWLRARPGQIHRAYIHTPLRYLWHDIRAPVLARPFLSFLRGGDRAAAARLDRMAVNSAWTAEVVQRAYRRRAEVIHPPVQTAAFQRVRNPGEGFLCISRLARHKRLEVVIAAFNRNGLPLTIAGDGPERERLAARAGPNIRFLGWVADEDRARLLAEARGFVHMAAEDFGIAVVEAQAAGCPVIAFNGGANRETVVDSETGVLAAEQTPESLNAALARFAQLEDSFEPERLRRHAAQFGEEVFRRRFAAFAVP